MASASDWFEKAAGALTEADALCAALTIRPKHPLCGGDWRLPGLPAVVPLWTDESWTFGLMAQPGQPVENWPGVMVWRDQAITLATDAATLLPRFLVARHISNFPDDAEELKRSWRRFERQLHDLHAALGGQESALAAVGAVVIDDRARSPFRYTEASRSDFQAAHEALFRAIDPSPEFTAFADWFVARVNGAASPPDPAAYGNWRRQALAWSCQFDIAAGELEGDFSLFAPLVTGHAGWDTGVSVAPSWYDPGSGGSFAFSAMAAQLIQMSATLENPIDQRLVKAVAKAGTAYDGVVHAVAVPELDEQGDGDRAWAALCAAAWWMQSKAGETPAAILDGARLLASHRGWDDIRWLTDREEEATR